MGGEVCSDRLDSDFPDIDLSQLDPSDFDSVNCLSELQWCSDQENQASPASIHYSSSPDQLFQVRHAQYGPAQVWNNVSTIGYSGNTVEQVFSAEGPEPGTTKL
ncbi:hypothetical protein WMY93_009267 [Mugilogobius chulae]|uniref:Uncharacterized protein n=1 Tax=Mugilogobius chulae TaxID=88201 RepID=A0AAW0PK67_9GOBI